MAASEKGNKIRDIPKTVTELLENIEGLLEAVKKELEEAKEV